MKNEVKKLNIYGGGAKGEGRGLGRGGEQVEGDKGGRTEGLELCKMMETKGQKG